MKKAIRKWLGLDTLTLMDKFTTLTVFEFMMKELQNDIKSIKKQLK